MDANQQQWACYGQFCLTKVETLAGVSLTLSNSSTLSNIRRRSTTNMSETMADDKEIVAVSTPDQPKQHSLPQFLEILCTSSGKIRRFSPYTEARFALRLINKKLDSGVPLALYIEAVKEGEEPISFCPKTKLIHYGDGWKLHTVTDHRKEAQCIQHKNDVVPPFDHLPDFVELARDDVQTVMNGEVHLIKPCIQDENKPMASEPVSDIESQSFAKWDFTDTFTTDKVFGSRDELVNWTRDVGRSVDNIVVIKYSSSGNSVKNRRPSICFGCEKGDKRRKYVRKKRSDKEPLTRQTVSKKCECPFLLRGMKMRSDDQWMVKNDDWMLKVECGYHNHPIEHRKLSAEEEQLVKNMVRAGLRGKRILQVLKDRDPRNETPLGTIYNIQTKLKDEMYGTSQCNSS